MCCVIVSRCRLSCDGKFDPLVHHLDASSSRGPEEEEEQEEEQEEQEEQEEEEQEEQEEEELNPKSAFETS